MLNIAVIQLQGELSQTGVIILYCMCVTEWTIFHVLLISVPSHLLSFTEHLSCHWGWQLKSS